MSLTILNSNLLNDLQTRKHHFMNNIKTDSYKKDSNKELIYGLEMVILSNVNDQIVTT